MWEGSSVRIASAVKRSMTSLSIRDRRMAQRTALTKASGLLLCSRTWSSGYFGVMTIYALSGDATEGP